MTKRKHKVLLIGSSGYQRSREDLTVDCCDWTKVAGIRNMRDFDTIIVDLLPLRTEESRGTVPWDDFFERLDFIGAMDILLHGGTFIIVGDPRFRVELTPSNSEKTSVPFLHWTGVKFAWDSEPGDTVTFESEYSHRQYADYISKLNKWQYSLSGCEFDRGKLAERFDLKRMEKSGMGIRLDRDTFCKNRYQNALAFILRLEIIQESYGNRIEVVQTSGPIIFLPEVSMSQDETLQRILTDICGIETNLPEPEWIANLGAPGQEAIDEEILRIKGQIESAIQALRKAHQQRQACRQCLKLLYEREYGLEPAVYDILRGLGAHVEEPTEKNKEDGWIVVKVGDITYEGVLEIKSTRSDTFSEDGRKQLLDWIDRGRTVRDKNYKGIFIGNNAVDKPVNDRACAFPDNWVKAAELSQICAFKTEDLYVFHLLNAKRQLNLDELWQDIFTTNGVLDMKKYWKALAPKEK